MIVNGTQRCARGKAPCKPTAKQWLGAAQRTVLAQSLAMRSSLAASEQSTLAVCPGPAMPTPVVSALVGVPVGGQQRGDESAREQEASLGVRLYQLLACNPSPMGLVATPCAS